MAGAGIIDGDIAVIQKKDHVENGDIAAVLIDQEATLKRVYLSSEKLVLKADNPIYEDLEFTVGNSNFIRIIGCFQGIIRTEHYRCNS